MQVFVHKSWKHETFGLTYDLKKQFVKCPQLEPLIEYVYDSIFFLSFIGV